MKTSELIKRVMEIDGVNDYLQSEEMLCFYASKQGWIVAYANRIKKFEISTDYGYFSKLSSSSQELLLDLLYQYAMTPLEKREEPKRYRLFHKLVEEDYERYLNFKVDENRLLFSDKNEGKFHKTIFTIKEWEEITDMSWDELLLQFNAEEEE